MVRQRRHFRHQVMPPTRASGSQGDAVPFTEQKRAELPAPTKIRLRIFGHARDAVAHRVDDAMLPCNCGEGRLECAVERSCSLARHEIEQPSRNLHVHGAEIDRPKQAPEL
jgi:hypothetical protein